VTSRVVDCEALLRVGAAERDDDRGHASRTLPG
jgi:hypothetical protein